MFSASVFLDISFLLLLLLVLFYCFRLNKRIVLVHESKQELLNLLQNFDNDISKCEVMVKDLKLVSKEASNALQQKIDKSLIIMDSLSFLHQKASNLVNEMSEEKKYKGKRSSQQSSVELKESEKIRNNLEVLMNKIAENNAEKEKDKIEPLSKDNKDVKNLLKSLGYSN